MEQIYKPKYDKVISMREVFQEYRQHLLTEELPEIPTSKHDIAKAIRFSGTSSQFQDLLQSIDIDSHLSSTTDLIPIDFNPSKVLSIQRPMEIPDQALTFESVKNAVKITGKLKKNLDCKIRYNKHKYSEVPQTEETNLEPYGEMLLAIRFYEPFKYKSGVRLGHPKFHQEFYVLGSQKLTELRDKIYCQCDLGPFFDISNDPSQPPPDDRDTRPDPGFFFIHNTFYNDFRRADNMDYSHVIRKWAERKKGIGELKTGIMEETSFNDLHFRLGYPQMYQHNGNCEHIFVISDCRLLSPADILSRRRYPFLNSYAFPRSIPCNICGHCDATMIIKNSDQHIFDPAYICQSCFDSYHFKDGRKIGEFEAYRFYGTKISVKDDENEIDMEG
ncbi:snRNA-activating protein complex subunit 3 [Uranotaenia lowii]|uniref:snRNA-activating protein complex subunit 3 n=1 Tax=Uranotaenia lowii TaxID=190385 RepID=UPI00247AC63F|nr:snRNA-activating protein complex subunit 3 [Uranotaenia lowii]